MRQRVKIVIKEDIVRELYAIAGEDAVQTAEPMKNHTTFRVGGPADYFVAPHTEEEIRDASSSVYMNIPILKHIDVVRNFDGKVAVVMTPCMLRGLDTIMKKERVHRL